jgi:hypothetical protein
MSTSESDPDKAWTRFYIEYGSAMLAWQIVESELATLFSKLTKIPPDMAVQIFYSARSFKGRIDIVKAALVPCKIPTEIKSFAFKLISKSKQYSDYRNKFAHDQPLLHQSGHPATFEVIVVDGKGQFQSDEVKAEYIKKAISTGEIRDIAAHFRNLADIIRDFWSLPLRSPLPETLHRQFAALPNLPPAKGQSLLRAKHKRPPPPFRT